MEQEVVYSLKSFFTIGHIIGVIIGVAAAYTGDFLFLKSIRDNRITAEEMRRIRKTSRVVWIGLSIIVIFGIGLFSLDPAYYLDSSKFLVKMTIVGILILNGIAFHFLHIPRLIRNIDVNLSEAPEIKANRKYLLISGAISSTSWFSALALGLLHSLPYEYWQILGAYLVIVLFAICSALLMRDKIFPR